MASTARKTRLGQTSARAKRHDAKLLGQAAAEDDSRPHANSITAALEKLREATEQVGYALAAARQNEDFDTVDNLTPILATVWSARMELGGGIGVKP